MHLEWNEHLKWKTDFITNLLKLGLCSNTTHLTQLFVLLMTVMLEKNFYNSKYVKRIHEGPGFRIPDSSFPDSGFQLSGFPNPYYNDFRIPNHCRFRIPVFPTPKKLLDSGFSYMGRKASIKTPEDDAFLKSYTILDSRSQLTCGVSPRPALFSH